MKKSILFMVTIFLFITSCDNMDRDDLINGISAPDNGEIQDSDIVKEEGQDNNETLDNNETSDDYTQPDEYTQEDNGNNVPDEENTEDSICGNNVIESGESCDSNSSTCSSILGDNYEGSALCKDDCSGFDTSQCSEVEQDTDVYYVDETKCNGCRRCIGSCDYGALSMSGFKAVIDPDKCTGCGDCAKRCPRSAIKKK